MPTVEAQEAIAQGQRVLDAAGIVANQLSQETRFTLTVLCVCHPEFIDGIVELIDKARDAEVRQCASLGGRS